MIEGRHSTGFDGMLDLEMFKTGIRDTCNIQKLGSGIFVAAW